LIKKRITCHREETQQELLQEDYSAEQFPKMYKAAFMSCFPHWKGRNVKKIVGVPHPFGSLESCINVLRASERAFIANSYQYFIFFRFYKND